MSTLSEPRAAGEVLRSDAPLGLSLPWILLISAFGPYLSPVGVRVEHVLIYGLVPASVGVLALRGRSPLFVRPVIAIWTLLAFHLLWSVASTVVTDGTGIRVATVAGNVDNLLQPLAILLILGAFFRVADVAGLEREARRLCLLLIAVLAVNGFLILVHIFADISWFFEPFLPARSLRGNVWDRALSLGRYTGIFATPFESGITYSLGLLAWAYVFRRAERVNGWYFVAFCLLLWGGAASVSKAFLLVGFPLFLLHLLLRRPAWNFTIRMRLVGLATMFAFLLLLSQLFVDQWRGFARLLRLLLVDGSNRDLLELYTAGRFGGDAGAEGTVANLWSLIMKSSPLAGLGLNQSYIVDSAYLHYLVLGGVASVAAYVGMLAVMGFVGLSSKGRSEEARFLLVLVVFVAVASVGGPVVTKNRFSTTFWVLVSVMILTEYSRRRALFSLKRVSRAHSTLPVRA